VTSLQTRRHGTIETIISSKVRVGVITVTLFSEDLEKHDFTMVTHGQNHTLHKLLKKTHRVRRENCEQIGDGD